jgi:hypothetical protein
MRVTEQGGRTDDFRAGEEWKGYGPDRGLDLERLEKLRRGSLDR